MEGRQECWYWKWLRAWGLQAQNLWTVGMQCSMVYKDGHTICSTFIEPRAITEQLTHKRTIWQDVPKILSPETSREAAIKGIFVKAQSLDARKW